MRVLLLNLGVDSLQAANSSLASQGYDVATNRGLAVDQVLALSPEVLVAEVTPSDLSCCGLIAQLKARPETESSLKIVMVVQGGAVERARALDLGAEDVISFPFEPVEFAARIRAQFRERKPQEELKTMLKHAVQREHFADIVLQLLTSPLGKRRLWLSLRRNLRWHRRGRGEELAQVGRALTHRCNVPVHATDQLSELRLFSDTLKHGIPRQRA